MDKYKNLMSIFHEDESQYHIPTGHIMVERRSRKTPLFHSSATVKAKNGEKKMICEIISSSMVTLLFFGSPRYKKSQQLAIRLKKLQEKSKDLGLTLEIVYIPLFTYVETELDVEFDFAENHGGWWMMGFQSWEATEAVFMHGVDTVPTLVVVDQEGTIITISGHNELAQNGNDVLITWF